MNTLNLTSALQDCLDEYLDELAPEEARCQSPAKDYDAIRLKS